MAASSYLALMLTAVRAGPPPCWAHAARHRPARKVADEYPQVELEELIVDATAALLSSTALPFRLIVTTNMFGDILSDEASELTGNLGLGGAINAGDTICVAQAQHGSRHRRPGRGQSHLADPVRRDAARLDRAAPRRLRVHRSRSTHHPRSTVPSTIPKPAPATSAAPWAPKNSLTRCWLRWTTSADTTHLSSRTERTAKQ